MNDDDPDGRGAKPAPTGGTWDLMAEAGIGHLRILADLLLTLTLAALPIAGLGLFVTSFVVNSNDMLVIGLGLTLIPIPLLLLMSWNRKRLVAKIRWEEATVTLRTVEPGGVSEDGQYVTCDVTLQPTAPRATAQRARMSTTVGPLDVPKLIVGETLRCRVDRAALGLTLRVYPYASPDAALPAGRELKFMSTSAPTRTDVSRERRGVLGAVGVFALPLAIAAAVAVGVAIPLWPKGPSQLHTEQGLAELLSLTRTHFGDLTGYELRVNIDYASIERAHPGDERVKDDYIYRRDEWRSWSQGSLTPIDALADLGGFDVAAITAQIADAPTLLDVDADPSQTFLLVRGEPGGTLDVAVYVSGNGLSGFVELTPDGKVQAAHPPS